LLALICVSVEKREFDSSPSPLSQFAPAAFTPTGNHDGEAFREADAIAQQWLRGALRRRREADISACGHSLPSVRTTQLGEHLLLDSAIIAGPIRGDKSDTAGRARSMIGQ